MRSVLILKLSPLDSAPRVYRTYMALKDTYQIYTAGFTSLGLEGNNFIDLEPYTKLKDKTISFHLGYPSLLRKFFSFFIKLFVLKSYSKKKFFENAYWTVQKREILKRLEKLKTDIVIVHGLDALPIGVKLSELHKSKLVFNAHEFYPREFEESEKWIKETQPLYNYLCNTYIGKTGLFFNVSEQIALEYKKQFGKDSVVLNNASDYKELSPRKCEDKIRMIHHGAAIRGRNIELMIECAEKLDDKFSLDLMLVPSDEAYYKQLKEIVLQKNNNKVRIIEPVSFSGISEYINQYDVGLYILPRTNFNNEMALPNKLFEFVQARLMLAISPNTEMASIVKKYNIGVIADDYTSDGLAKKLSTITVAEVNAYKANADKCARELNAERNARLILESLNSLN